MTEQPAENPRVPLWARAMTNEADFRAEQDKLGTLWSFLGFTPDIPEVNDWFRTTLGGRSIFIQRFEIGIRAFENRCAHRFFPLRTEAKGSGPVVCGFHHWRYNADGLALGIPKCQEMFGKTPRELDARLAPVEIELCGTMIFGRLTGGHVSGDGVTLKEWLGEGFDILTYLSATPTPMRRIEKTVRAHWKLMMEISLDDYHIVAVHPTTFGKDGYLKQENVRYFRFGAHSAYIPGGEPGALRDIERECRERGYFPHRYRIFQFFPNLIVAVIRAVDYLGETYWFLLVQNLIPEAHDRTRSLTQFFPLPFREKGPGWRQLARRLAMPWIALGFDYYTRKVHIEDNEACESLQSATGLINGPPVLAAHEERVKWFEEEYARILGG